MYDLVVVGAGPYGLSIAAHAGNAGLHVRVFGRPMASWRDMPRGMYLKTEPWASDLSDPDGRHTLADYCADRGLSAEHGDPPRVDTFARYGLWFAQQAAPRVEERMITAVRPYLDHFQVRTEDGEVLYSRTVVLAVGTPPFAHLPDAVRGLPTDLVSHSVAHHDLSVFRDRDVTVLGAGQGALETATLLAEQGAHPRLVARATRLNWDPPPKPLTRPMASRALEPHCALGVGWPAWIPSRSPGAVRALPAPLRLRIADRVLGPAGAWWLRDRCESRVPVRLARTLRAAGQAGDRVRLELDTLEGGTETLETDHLIVATGFVPDLDRLTLLHPVARDAVRTLGPSRAPRLTPGFRSSLPGLYFAGLLAAPAFGPAMRFVHGAGFTAQRVVRDVRRHLGQRRTAHLPQVVRADRVDQHVG